MKQSRPLRRLSARVRVGSLTHVYRCESRDVFACLYQIVKDYSRGRLTKRAAWDLETQLTEGAKQ